MVFISPFFLLAITRMVSLMVRIVDIPAFGYVLCALDEGMGALDV